MRCKACGEEMAAHERFCGSCGAPVAPPPPVVPDGVSSSPVAPVVATTVPAHVPSSPAPAAVAPLSNGKRWIGKTVPRVAMIVVLAALGYWFAIGRTQYAENRFYQNVIRGESRDVKSYLDAGGNPNVRQGEGQMPALHVAAHFGDLQTILALIAAGADVNAVDGNGTTALGWAALDGKPAVVKALLDGGAKVDTNDKTLAAALQAARTGKRDELVKLLEDAGAK